MTLHDIARVLRRIIGAPDYESYQRYCREHRPSELPLAERAFRERQLEARYSRPGSRCC